MTSKYRSDIKPSSLLKWDIIEGFKKHEIWLNLAWSELSARYGRTIIGVLWNVVSFSIFCIAIIFIFGSIASIDLSYFGPHVIIGFLIYSYIASLVTDSCNVFSQNENWIKSLRLPYGIFVYKGIARNTIIFAFNVFAAIIILLIFFHMKFYLAQWLIAPALIIIFINSVSVYFLFGFLGARYRDFVYLITTIMRFVLFVTPIMWVADDGSMRGIIAKYNPFTHFIEIIREPLLYGRITIESWYVVFVITFLSFMLSILIYLLTRKRLIYWL